MCHRGDLTTRTLNNVTGFRITEALPLATRVYIDNIQT